MVFDTQTSTIPLPSDLALEDDGTLPFLGDPDGPGSAQRDFYTYLDSLHGWLPSTGMSVPVGGPIDEETLTTDAVLLFEFADDGSAEQIEVADVAFTAAEQGEGGEISIVPAAPLELGTRYGYVLTQALEDPQGNPVVAAQPTWFQLSSESLVETDEEGNIVTNDDDEPIVTNDLLAQAASPAEAGQLEQARQLMQPVVNAAIEAGVDRYDIIAVSHWHTALDTFAVFDPNTSTVPFPNDAIRTGEGDTVNLPIPEDADDLTAAVLSELNRRDGFSITADGWIPLSGGQLDPETITPENIPLAWVVGTTPTLYDSGMYELTYRPDFEGAGVITYGPTIEPFRQGLTHVGVVTDNVQDVNGWAIKPSTVFVFLRSEHDLVDAEGNSLVEQLGDEQAQALTAARDQLQLIFLGAQLPPFSYDLQDLAVVWPFMTDVATEYQQQMNARAEALTNAEGVTAPVGNPAGAEVDPAGFNNVGIIQRHSDDNPVAFMTQWFIDPDSPTGLTDEPTTQPVPLTITVPSEENCDVPEDGYPIVIAGHGLGGEREDATALFADVLAGECLATVSLDFPLHGLRVAGDEESGELFLTANVIATKNNFLQAVVDLAVLTEVIKAERFENALDIDQGTNLIDESQIGYVGVSLGGMIGTNFLATDSDVTVGALNVPGGKLVEVVQFGTIGEALVEQLLGEGVHGNEAPTFDVLQLFTFLQWIVEPGDPWTFAPHVINDPLSVMSYDVDSGEFTIEQDGDDPLLLPSNEVIIQMAGEDTLIPNRTTELLAEAMGVSLEDTTFEGASHGFLGQVVDGDENAICALGQIGAWLSSGLDGDDDEDSAVLPEQFQNACQ